MFNWSGIFKRDKKSLTIYDQSVMSNRHKRIKKYIQQGIIIIFIFMMIVPVYAKVMDKVIDVVRTIIYDETTVVEKPPIFDIGIDGESEIGGLQTRSEEEIQADLNKKVEASMINISMNLSPVFQTGESKGNLLIVNEEINNYMQVVEIYLNGTNELIYRSGGIPVGSKIEMASLDRALEKGDYDCTAYFNAVNSETGELIGKAGAAITISVLN